MKKVLRINDLKQSEEKQPKPKETKAKEEQLICDVCGSTDIIEEPHMGRNCNMCNPL